MHNFALEGHEFVSLCDLLKLTGWCHSGGAAKIAISEGQVLVDGQIELRKRCKIRPGQIVEFAGQRITVATIAGN